jgi:hypothetical protein
MGDVAVELVEDMSVRIRREERGVDGADILLLSWWIVTDRLFEDYRSSRSVTDRLFEDYRSSMSEMCRARCF